MLVHNWFSSSFFTTKNVWFLLSTFFLIFVHAPSPFSLFRSWRIGFDELYDIWRFIMYYIYNMIATGHLSSCRWYKTTIKHYSCVIYEMRKTPRTASDGLLVPHISGFFRFGWYYDSKINDCVKDSALVHTILCVCIHRMCTSFLFAFPLLANEHDGIRMFV